MSTIDPGLKQAEPDTGQSAQVGTGNGSPTDTLPNSRETDGPRLIPQPHGGALMSGGVPGHPGYGGRPAEKVRRDATESLERFVGRIGNLMGSTVELAESELAEGTVNVNRLTALLNQVSKMAATLTSIGPGTKVTNVVEREGYHDAASRAYDQSHDKLSFLEALKRELDGIP